MLPVQTFIEWCIETYFLSSTNIFSLGFSGVIYGINAFIFWSSIYGKMKFLSRDIILLKNKEVRNAMYLITLIGIFWSFKPEINMISHIAGFLAGSVLFLF